MAYADSVETRQAVIDACLRMGRDGVNHGTSGNVSVRVGDAMLITPSGLPYDQMVPADLVLVPLDGGAPVGHYKPSSEWQFHLGLLNARPDMNAVVHAHPTYCTALAMLRQSIPQCHYMIAAFGGNSIPLVDYALFGSEALADRLVAAMSDRHGCLMSNHGAVVLGEDLERGLWRMVELEALAQSYMIARQAGEVVLLSDAEIDETLAAIAGYGPKAKG